MTEFEATSKYIKNEKKLNTGGLRHCFLVTALLALGHLFAFILFHAGAWFNFTQAASRVRVRVRHAHAHAMSMNLTPVPIPLLCWNTTQSRSSISSYLPSPFVFKAAQVELVELTDHTLDNPVLGEGRLSTSARAVQAEAPVELTELPPAKSMYAELEVAIVAAE